MAGLRMNGVLYRAETPWSAILTSASGCIGIRRSISNLTVAPTTQDGGVVVVAGDAIAIQMSSIVPTNNPNVYTGPFTLSLSLATPPETSTNDAFRNRFGYGTAYHFDGSINGARWSRAKACQTRASRKPMVELPIYQ